MLPIQGGPKNYTEIRNNAKVWVKNKFILQYILVLVIVLYYNI